MKKLKQELRMYLIERLFGICISLAPNNKEGHEVISLLSFYFTTKLTGK